MIVSIHIPKTAGTSFRSDLSQLFGDRLLQDYDDWPESRVPEARAHHERNRAAVLAEAAVIADRYDAIHGHFLAGKYGGVFPVTALVTMVRDPYQHAVSSYEDAARRSDSPHPGFRRFKEEGMTLVDFIEAVPNHQSLYLDSTPLEDFAVVGLTERYEQSVALFGAVFGIAMPRAVTRKNVNPEKAGVVYEITPAVRRAVERYRAEDIALYRKAGESLAKLCSVYGVSRRKTFMMNTT